MQKVVWWLSVDNNGGSFKGFSQTSAEGVVHVSNSQYGVEYLEKRGIKEAILLPDYVHAECADAVHCSPQPLHSEESRIVKERDRIIAYNPSKGSDVTNRIIAAISHYQISGGAQDNARVLLVPVQHMKSSAALLSRARVYIDFGHHPGQVSSSSYDSCILLLT